MFECRAKPGHGGILPRSKLTDLIREARGLPDDWDEDVNSPPSHSGVKIRLTVFLSVCAHVELLPVYFDEVVSGWTCTGPTMVVLDLSVQHLMGLAN